MLIYAIFMCAVNLGGITAPGMVNCQQNGLGLHASTEVPQGTIFFASKPECEEELQKITGWMPRGSGADEWRCLGRRVETWQ